MEMPASPLLGSEKTNQEGENGLWDTTRGLGRKGAINPISSPSGMAG